jgi:hypothetical protein
MKDTGHPTRDLLKSRVYCFAVIVAALQPILIIAMVLLGYEVGQIVRVSLAAIVLVLVLTTGRYPSNIGDP